jgi:hypothetical protein
MEGGEEGRGGCEERGWGGGEGVEKREGFVFARQDGLEWGERGEKEKGRSGSRRRLSELVNRGAAGFQLGRLETGTPARLDKAPEISVHRDLDERQKR